MTRPTLRICSSVVLGVCLLSAACGPNEWADAPSGPELDLSRYPLPRLSEYRFFVGELEMLEANANVISYSVNAPLWSDGSEKGRFFVLPDGGKIGWTPQDEWGFPSGTVFIKSFFFDRDSGPDEDLDIIETRLLVRNGSRWDSHVYLWNDDRTDATHIKAGADVFVRSVDEEGREAEQLYLVPDQNTCETCHLRDQDPVVLGPTTSQLNRDWPMEGEWVNQIDWLRDAGLFAEDVPPASTLPTYPNPAAGDATLDARARAYLHGNCAHCHRPGGGGGSSGLRFTYDVDQPEDYGVCKVPAAAGAGAGGRRYSIVPGDPDASIVPFRMASADPQIKMPELPNLLPDAFGVELVTAWIAAMDPLDCAAVDSGGASRE